ncbi:MAG: glucose-6-phosphate isomerase [Hydrogenothermaceae bacterium]|nr:glucose-6-phosphate isomerase [Hydrogenothermaceae bacterium]
MIKIDYSNVMSEKLGEREGILVQEIEAYRQIILDLHKEIYNRKDKDFYFMNLPFQDISKIKETARKIKENFDCFVVVGIGGSALGNQTVQDAVNGLDYNLKNFPKFYVLDNVDPEKFALVMDQIDVRKTIFNVITKSGSTVETVANFLIVLDMLKTVIGDNWKRHIIITTDPEKGFLRKFANQEGIESFDIPPNLGGRFSVLSNVGLLSAAVCGIDIDELLEGAKYGYQLCEKSIDPFGNPAYLIGLIHYIANVKKGKTISVMMAYSERLSSFVNWYRQLWAESLGKEGLGQTPVKSIGSIDQHSQIQLYIDGPKDKIVTFLNIEESFRDFEITGDIPTDLEYLKGKTLKQILDIELEGTKAALVKAKVPNLTITLDKPSPFNIGLLIYLYEMATGFSGLLYKVNPFDQPAVEEGKNFAYGLMGRKGYEEKLNEYKNLSKITHLLEI